MHLHPWSGSSHHLALVSSILHHGSIRGSVHMSYRGTRGSIGHHSIRSHMSLGTPLSWMRPRLGNVEPLWSHIDVGWSLVTHDCTRVRWCGCLARMSRAIGHGLRRTGLLLAHHRWSLARHGSRVGRPTGHCCCPIGHMSHGLGGYPSFSLYRWALIHAIRRLIDHILHCL